MKITRSQLRDVSDGLRSAHWKAYLAEHFPESLSMPAIDLEQAIARVAERAGHYKLVRDAHVAPYLVAAWVLGEGFEPEFPYAKALLENLELDVGTKAERLWAFLELTVEALESDD